MQLAWETVEQIVEGSPRLTAFLRLHGFLLNLKWAHRYHFPFLVEVALL